MFGFFGNKDKEGERQLNSPFDLKKGDIITFKPKAFLPDELAAADFTVEQETTYQYASGNISELVIKGADSRVYYLAIDPNDGDPTLCIAQKLSRHQVEDLFDGNTFAELFEGDFVTLEPLHQPTELNGWVANRYFQSSQDEQGFFYNEACQPDEYSEGGEEFRLFEFAAEPDHFSLSIEVYGDGSTEVLLEISGGFEIIDQMWPKT